MHRITKFILFDVLVLK